MRLTLGKGAPTVTVTRDVAGGPPEPVQVTVKIVVETSPVIT